jgi:hypothetical protein
MLPLLTDNGTVGLTPKVSLFLTTPDYLDKLVYLNPNDGLHTHLTIFQVLLEPDVSTDVSSFFELWGYTLAKKAELWDLYTQSHVNLTSLPSGVALKDRIRLAYQSLNFLAQYADVSFMVERKNDLFVSNGFICKLEGLSSNFDRVSELQRALNLHRTQYVLYTILQCEGFADAFLENAYPGWFAWECLADQHKYISQIVNSLNHLPEDQNYVRLVPFKTVP